MMRGAHFRDRRRRAARAGVVARGRAEDRIHYAIPAQDDEIVHAARFPARVLVEEVRELGHRPLRGGRAERGDDLRARHARRDSGDARLRRELRRRDNENGQKQKTAHSALLVKRRRVGGWIRTTVGRLRNRAPGRRLLDHREGDSANCSSQLR